MATDWLRAKEKSTIGDFRSAIATVPLAGGRHIKTIATVGVIICAVGQFRAATRVGRAGLGHLRSHIYHGYIYAQGREVWPGLLYNFGVSVSLSGLKWDSRGTSKEQVLVKHLTAPETVSKGEQ